MLFSVRLYVSSGTFKSTPGVNSGILVLKNVDPVDVLVIRHECIKESLQIPVGCFRKSKTSLKTANFSNQDEITENETECCTCIVYRISCNKHQKVS